jgi:hypothetical protein
MTCLNGLLWTTKRLLLTHKDIIFSVIDLAAKKSVKVVLSVNQVFPSVLFHSQCQCTSAWNADMHS